MVLGSLFGKKKEAGGGGGGAAVAASGGTPGAVPNMPFMTAEAMEEQRKKLQEDAEFWEKQKQDGQPEEDAQPTTNFFKDYDKPSAVPKAKAAAAKAAAAAPATGGASGAVTADQFRQNMANLKANKNAEVGTKAPEAAEKAAPAPKKAEPKKAAPKKAEPKKAEPNAVAVDEQPPTPEPEDLEPDALPEGWREAVSKSTGKTFYWHVETKERTFDRPTKNGSAPAANPNPSQVGAAVAPKAKTVASKPGAAAATPFGKKPLSDEERDRYFVMLIKKSSGALPPDDMEVFKDLHSRALL